MSFVSVALLASIVLGPHALSEELANEGRTADSRYVIVYGSTAWNTSPTKINSAFLVIRDKISKKLIQVQLEETAPDSSEFRGSFHFKLADQSSIQPQVYIPPQSLRNQMDQFYQLILNGKVARKPTIIKRTKEESIIDVYDTVEQAQRAWEVFQESQAIRAKAKIPDTPAIPQQPNVLADAKELEAKRELDKEQERIRLEQIEKQKLQERIEAEKRLNEAEKQKRIRQAQKLSEEGMRAYDGGNYTLAEEKFRQSSELDPNNKEFFYKYGVSLYKNEKLNEALVVFNLAPVQKHLQDEKDYYIGLSHFKLNENRRALAQFRKVSESGDPVLSPSSHFYTGVIHFNQEEFDESKVAFETVIDTSKDPKLDERAEEYIEAIARAQTLAKMREKKWFLTGTAGLMYDSNVLLAPDLQTAQGVSNEEGDVRLVTVGDVVYKAYLSEKSSFDINANANLTNSSKNDLAYADPWLYSLSTPYSYQWSGTKPGKLTFTPGYETLFMAENGNSEKKNILNSLLGKVGYLTSQSQSWFSNYTFEYRMDDFSIASSIGDNDLDANRITLGTTQTALLGSRKKEALAGTLRVARNEAKGKNRTYNRYEVGITFAKPVWRTSSWATSLGYYFLEFPDSDTNRKDNNVTLTSALAKPIRDWFTWGVTGSFTNNVSTESSQFSYTRYTIMTTATFNTAF